MNAPSPFTVRAQQEGQHTEEWLFALQAKRISESLKDTPSNRRARVHAAGYHGPLTRAEAAKIAAKRHTKQNAVR